MRYCFLHTVNLTISESYLAPLELQITPRRRPLRNPNIIFSSHSKLTIQAMASLDYPLGR
jgi:hypothetical protein